MGGHLAAAGRGIGFGSYGREQHIFRRHTQSETQRAIAIIGEKPVVAGLEQQAGSSLNGFVSGARDLEIDFILPLEKDFPVVDAAGGGAGGGSTGGCVARAAS